ncbi:MAG: hypothetical protein KME30_31740 [Iphinoe sp. HA4291-MV1]|jgi:hypothetical protein|nr:hypothetical protein [Iphinoe sp. HA4291-MV1]
MPFDRKKTPRPNQKTLWLTDEEKQLLKELSERTGLNEASVIRSALRAYSAFSFGMTSIPLPKKVAA